MIPQCFVIMTNKYYPSYVPIIEISDFVRKFTDLGFKLAFLCPYL